MKKLTTIVAFILLFSMTLTACNNVKNPSDVSDTPAETPSGTPESSQPPIESQAPITFESYLGFELGMSFPDALEHMEELEVRSEFYIFGDVICIYGDDYDVLIKLGQANEDDMVGEVKNIYRIDHSIKPTPENIQKLTEGMDALEVYMLLGFPTGSYSSGVKSITYKLPNGDVLTITGSRTSVGWISYSEAATQTQ
jgi:hypothetical protein